MKAGSLSLRDEALVHAYGGDAITSFKHALPSWQDVGYAARTLRALGLTPPSDLTVVTRKGHHNSATVGGQGQCYFVKCGDGSGPAVETLSIEASLLRYLHAASDDARVPTVVASGFDEFGRPVLVTAVLEGHTSLLDNYATSTGEQSAGYARRAGLALGALHQVGVEGCCPALFAALDGRIPAGPTMVTASAVQGISADFWAGLSGGAMELLGLCHRDQPTRAAAGRLFEQLAQPGTRTLVHGDLRPDHVLVDAQGDTVFADWETAHLGRPEEDIGSIVAEWLLLALMSISAEDVAPGSGGPAGTFAEAAFEALQRIVPTVGAFMDGQRSAHSAAVDPELVGAAAGGAMVGRLLAMVSSQAYADSRQRSILGLATALLKEPGAFMCDIGLGAAAT
jgi:aminoglycoside phosphotransferase (APT) family kinase protein